MSSLPAEEDLIATDKAKLVHYQKEAKSKSLKVTLAQWGDNPNFFEEMVNEQSDVLGLAQAMDQKMAVMAEEETRLEAKIKGFKQLQDICAMFDKDGDGVLDDKELSAARDLIKSLKLSQEEDDHLSKIDALKKEEKLAHIKREEEEETRMIQHHESIKARLEQRKKNRSKVRGSLEKSDEVVAGEVVQAAVKEPPKNASKKVQPTL
ncbi:hypothetical protein TrVE_jg11204 [Triparma verrucosa]|uniref:EF-hand domain-containing protein n=2 Tax=Triparma TaxID=722752 RepID=A0A9W7B1E3_9STRA|nr:hypothetical protein TrST_g882 [Triparma strigata]GMI04056.1 hypothetical protein TrVE_jg11204 [Triparma verrucosa]